MVENYRIDELQAWMRESRLHADLSIVSWYGELVEALDELKWRRRNDSHKISIAKLIRKAIKQGE